MQLAAGSQNAASIFQLALSCCLALALPETLYNSPVATWQSLESLVVTAPPELDALFLRVLEIIPRHHV